MRRNRKVMIYAQISPVTVAVNCWVALGAIVTNTGATVTAMLCPVLRVPVPESPAHIPLFTV